MAVCNGTDYSVYTVLERLIKYLEKKDTDTKLIDKLKECKDLEFMKD